ncbi:CDGSH iron-sulfur domain-containing protein [Brevibacterium sediminis]|nr:CDGSH iron-sulfur domain-containing protein [Brevibacterium sediminis]
MNTTPTTTITPCPDGPLLIRGDFAVLTAPGREETATERRVVALCRCGKTGIPPLCDGSHRAVGFRAPAPPPTEDQPTDPEEPPDNG